METQEFLSLWVRGINAQSEAEARSKAKKGGVEYNIRRLYLDEVDSVVRQILEEGIKYVSSFELVTRKGGSWQVLQLTYNNQTIKIPWPKLGEHLQEKVKEQMNTNVTNGKWLEILAKNAEITWQECPKGGELKWFFANREICPRYSQQKNGIEVVLWRRTWYLLPPEGNNIRVASWLYEHYGPDHAPELEVYERRSAKAKQYLNNFASTSTENPGHYAAYGYFVAYATEDFRFSARRSASGFFAYANSIPADGSDPNPDAPAMGEVMYDALNHEFCGPDEWRTWALKTLNPLNTEILAAALGYRSPQWDFANRHDDGSFLLMLKVTEGFALGSRYVHIRTTTARLEEAGQAVLQRFKDGPLDPMMVVTNLDDLV